MKRTSILVLFGLLVLAPGCISFRLGTEDHPSVQYSGLGNAYAGYSGFDEWDGDIIKLGLFGGRGRPNEIISFDIWPLGGFGIGLAGARVRVLPLELGAGTLFYSPSLPRREEIYEDLPGPEEPIQPEPSVGEETKTRNEADDKK